MKAVIQAGGKGTRVSDITGDVIPKPMLEISGYPILYHQMMNLKRNGIIRSYSYFFINFKFKKRNYIVTFMICFFTYIFFAI